ncbi:DUF2188 domain-containing protein [Sediminibacillus massiliensis]|uniref:DUF2188 domain-containing protein n=1 Tax=Sediminibacillus massiliensis TaxID=1926277 RepID=UPI0009886F21|nr:DUF2188 domain-containing protein [Sediminibacillus massiliensis]
MPWTMNDYPSSMKNFEPVLRKKAIEIANAMVDEGYEEGRAIPIATEQAKEWYENASEKEIKEFEEQGNPAKRSNKKKSYENRPELLDEGEHVVPHDKGWAVQAKDAKKPTKVYENKSDAVEHAKEIAENKGTEAVIHKRSGDIEKKHNFSD